VVPRRPQERGYSIGRVASLRRLAFTIDPPSRTSTRTAPTTNQPYEVASTAHLRACKLYDLERRAWTDFAGNITLRSIAY
jgi:hypothetical protein